MSDEKVNAHPIPKEGEPVPSTSREAGKKEGGNDVAGAGGHGYETGGVTERAMQEGIRRAQIENGINEMRNICNGQTRDLQFLLTAELHEMMELCQRLRARINDGLRLCQVLEDIRINNLADVDDEFGNNP